jgi:hypothetical protein
MYLSAYHFDGDHTEPTAANEQLMSRFPLPPFDSLLLQALAVGETGVTVIDACPDKAIHEQLVVSAGFCEALAGAGLPPSRVEALGEVGHALCGAVRSNPRRNPGPPR